MENNNTNYAAGYIQGADADKLYRCLKKQCAAATALKQNEFAFKLPKTGVSARFADGETSTVFVTAFAQYLLEYVEIQRLRRGQKIIVNGTWKTVKIKRVNTPPMDQTFIQRYRAFEKRARDGETK